ncbi:unnamed protein product [Durusdinium trenchii]|uniref:Uncharacterized protein n=1 Tax=Durusdinium trenchii TaxID=1381693 RepID=A0ABP0M326_9DINO
MFIYIYISSLSLFCHCDIRPFDPIVCVSLSQIADSVFCRCVVCQSPMQPEQAEEAQHVVGQNGAYGAYEQNSGYNAYGGMPMHMQYQLAPVEMCIVLPPLLKSAAFASKRCLGKEFL